MPKLHHLIILLIYTLLAVLIAMFVSGTTDLSCVEQNVRNAIAVTYFIVFIFHLIIYLIFKTEY